MIRVCSLLRQPEAERWFGDGPPFWREGRHERPPETAAEADRRRANLAKALLREESRASVDLAARLRACSEGNHCLDGACPSCVRGMKRMLVAATTDGPHLRECLFVTVIAGNRIYGVDALGRRMLFAELRRELALWLEVHEIAVIGGMEASVTLHPKGRAHSMAEHAHLLLLTKPSADAMASLRRLFRSSTEARQGVRVIRGPLSERLAAYALKIRDDVAEPAVSTMSEPLRVRLACARHRLGLDRSVISNDFRIYNQRHGRLSLAATATANVQ